MERMFVNLDRYGNTSAASVPLALAEAVDAGRIRQGDNVVIVAFGAGFTSGAVAFEWTADPAAGARAAAIRPDEIRVRLPSTGTRWTHPARARRRARQPRAGERPARRRRPREPPARAPVS